MGKDAPKNPPPNTPPVAKNKHGKTCGLLLRLCVSLYCTGKVVILDSGFCVLQAIVELRKKGVYAAAVIKKRRYWPKYIPGVKIDEHMEGRSVSDFDCLAGTLDNVNYNIFCMKEEDYTMKLMSTYGGLVEP